MLLWVGMGDNFTPYWFSLNNSETLKAFGSIQKHFIRDIHAKFGISNSIQSPDIGQNSDRGISDFRIFGQSLIKENCHNSRTSNDIDINVGPVTKHDKRNKTTSKKIDDDAMSKNCDVIAIFLIYGQFRAIRKPDSGRTVCNTYIFIKITKTYIFTTF